MKTGLPTVHDVWRIVLPATTELANTGGDLARPVFWARRMASHAPAFATLEENEIVLLSVDTLQLIDDRLTLAKVVESLTARNVAALAIVGKITSQAITVADKHKLCLLALPDDVDLRDIERDIVRLIVEREAQLDRRGRQIYRQLAQFSIENQGLTAIAEALRQIVKKPVVIQNEHLVIQTLALTEAFPFSPDTLSGLLADRAAIHSWLLDRSLDSTAPPSTYIDFQTGDWARCVTAIVIEGQLRGYLSILGPKDSLDDLDRLAAERGALVCAVELAKQRAVEAAEYRLRGDFVDMLLTASAAEESALARRAAEMGYALERHHTAVLFGVVSADASRVWSLVANEFRAGFLNTETQVFLSAYEGKLAAFCSVNDVIAAHNLMTYVQTVRERVMALSPGVQLAVGIGKQGFGRMGLRRSFSQAQEALNLAQSLFDGDKVLSFGDLGLYHLLHRLQECEEMAAFHDQTLAPLLAYDEEHDTQLVITLQAFFMHHGNVSQTAEALHLHRNSLLYRLERIHEITEMDLNNVDDRFALQLALKLKPLLNCE